MSDLSKILNKTFGLPEVHLSLNNPDVVSVIEGLSQPEIDKLAEHLNEDECILLKKAAQALVDAAQARLDQISPAGG